MVECEFHPRGLSVHLSCRFNRYMVECEYCKLTSYWFAYIVLIDTWWNVNVASAEAGEDAALVLIDTWWNVNVGKVTGLTVFEGF